LDTGAFGIYIGTSPEKKEQAINSVWNELKTIREERVEKEELDRAKNILISQYELALQTHSAQALELGLNETYGLGQDFGNRYIEAIREIDAAKVIEIARKYIVPDAYVMVAVGADLTDKAGESVGPGTGSSVEPQQ
jgi:zinc protease